MNINELLIYLNNFTFKFDVIILSEIWSNFEVSTDRLLNGYEYFYKINKTNKAGGVVIYIKSSFQATDFDLSFLQEDEKLDIIGVSFKHMNLRYNIFGLYHHHKNLIRKFSNIILDIKLHLCDSHKTIFVGDFNVNMLNYGMNLDNTEWVDTLLENEFTFIIQSPTRVTNTTKTIIDNYVLYGTPFKHDDILQGSINTYVTDHNAIIIDKSLV